jgi:hypothetical protein
MLLHPFMEGSRVTTSLIHKKFTAARLPLVLVSLMQFGKHALECRPVWLVPCHIFFPRFDNVLEQSHSLAYLPVRRICNSKWIRSSGSAPAQANRLMLLSSMSIRFIFADIYWLA